MLVGLTGGMACGKSFVARTFAELGAHVIEADELGRTVMAPGGAAYEAIVSSFGRGIVLESGEIDRAALAAQVFGHDEALIRLNGLVHPAVRASALQLATEHTRAVVIYVAAILIESGAYRDCSKVVVASCTPEKQMERALSREGATEQNVRARLSHQLPLEEKLRLANYVIDTNGTKQETVRQTTLVYEELSRFAL